MLKHGALGQLKSSYGAREVAVMTRSAHRLNTVFCVKAGTLVMFISGPYHAQWSRTAGADVLRVFVVGHGFGLVHDDEFVPL